MENSALLIIGVLFVITIFVAGYKTGASNERNRNEKLIEYFERQLDKFIVDDNERKDENDYWRRYSN